MGEKRDWNEYNKQLVNRGKINLWIKPEALEQWKPAKVKKNGPPFRYSNELIKTMSFLPFSCIEAIGSVVHTPCYTQICRTMKTLQIPAELLGKKTITDIALDTTGLKVYREGEWRWKKLHLALDPESGQLIIAEITDEYVHDTTYLEDALKAAGK
jgi:hypothetical protein